MDARELIIALGRLPIDYMCGGGSDEVEQAEVNALATRAITAGGSMPYWPVAQPDYGSRPDDTRRHDRRCHSRCEPRATR